MRFYLAPLEGITGYVFRNAYADFFGEIDKYFTPFIAPNQHGRFSTRELHDILPENNPNKVVVPQILTNNADDFKRTAKQLLDYGYTEINLNLGCPSGTVVSKKKGSGFLAYPEELDSFLEQIFTSPVSKISIKTRLGRDDKAEWDTLLDIFNKYPLEELIVHPRIRQDFYKGQPDREAFQKAIQVASHPLCYNGDLFTVNDYRQFQAACPHIEQIMIGRGILTNPGLIKSIKTGELMDQVHFKKFLERLCMDYQQVLSGERNVLFKMKELWFYIGYLFPDSVKYIKKVKKAQTLAQYQEALDQLFENKTINPMLGLFSELD